MNAQTVDSTKASLLVNVGLLFILPTIGLSNLSIHLFILILSEELSLFYLVACSILWLFFGIFELLVSLPLCLGLLLGKIRITYTQTPWRLDSQSDNQELVMGRQGILWMHWRKGWQMSKKRWRTTGDLVVLLKKLHNLKPMSLFPELTL